MNKPKKYIINVLYYIISPLIIVLGVIYGLLHLLFSYSSLQPIILGLVNSIKEEKR